MDTNAVKQAIVKTYGQLAKAQKASFFSKLFSCCDPAEKASTVAKTIGYSQAELAAVPEKANLGVGCGNPSAFADLKAGETLVDLGSGAGFDAFIVARQVGAKGKVIGIDLADEMLTLARENARKGGYQNVEFVKGDIEALPLDEAIADHIISNCVINLSLRKDKVFQEAYRVLKPGGQLSISDVILEKALPDFIKNALAGHVACVSGAEPLSQYLQYLENAGFQNIEVVSESPFPLALMLADPHIAKLAQTMNIDLNGQEAAELAGRVKSVSIRARKY